jgi:hypothetical protein
MMKLYHGTTWMSAKKIMKSGFRGSERVEFTGGFESDTKIGEGVVFLTDNPKEARGYGPCVFTVEIENPDFFQECPMSNANEYVVEVNAVNAARIIVEGKNCKSWFEKRPVIEVKL